MAPARRKRPYFHHRGFVWGLIRAETIMTAGAATIRPIKSEDCEALASIWEAGWQQVDPAPLLVGS